MPSDLGGGGRGGAHEVTLRLSPRIRTGAKMGRSATSPSGCASIPGEPERLLELSADTAAGDGGYHERMVLIAEE